MVRLVKCEQFTTSKISMTTLKISLKITMPTLKKLWQDQWQHWKEPWQYPRTPGDRIGSLRRFSPRGLSSITPKTFSWCHEGCQVYCDLKSKQDNFQSDLGNNMRISQTILIDLYYRFYIVSQRSLNKRKTNTLDSCFKLLRHVPVSRSYLRCGSFVVFNFAHL